MTEYAANLKKDVTEVILQLDDSTNKIKELSKGMDMEVLKKLSFNIWDELQSNYPQFLDKLPKISKDSFELIPALKFIYSAIPLLAKQREIDSSALKIYERLKKAKDLIGSGEEPLKNLEAAKCNECLIKSEEILTGLKGEFSSVYEQLEETKRVREQIGRYKQRLQESVFSLAKQIILISENEIKLFESTVNSRTLEFDPNKVAELGKLLKASLYFMSLLEMQFKRELRSLIKNYVRDTKDVKVDEMNDGAKRLNIVPKREKSSKSGQDFAKEITPGYFKFLKTFIDFVKRSKHIEMLQLGDLFISCAVNELMNYWIKNHISPFVHHFKQEIIDDIYKKFTDFVDVYGIF